MNPVLPLRVLFLANFAGLGILSVYLLTKIRNQATVPFLLLALLPLVVFEIGSFRFFFSASSQQGASLIALAIALVPIGITPISHTLGRVTKKSLRSPWVAYYFFQVLFLIYVMVALRQGGIIEWVTGILDQPVIIIEQDQRFLFLNTLLSSAFALACFDNTLRHAGARQSEALKFIFIGFLGVIVYFCYLSFTILTTSYVTESMLHAGTAVVFLAVVLLSYSFAKYPLWDVKIHVSRRIVFGSLSFTAAAAYLLISGSLLDLLRSLEPARYQALFPATVFAFVAVFLSVYLSPNFTRTAKSFVTRNFFRNKYDYRDLWMKFSEKSSGALNLKEVLPRVAEFIADAMFVRQVAIWLRVPTSDSFSLAYCHQTTTPVSSDPPLRVARDLVTDDFNVVYKFSETPPSPRPLPLDSVARMKDLGISRFVLVEKGNEALAILGIGAESGGREPGSEDDRLLLSVSSQLGYLIFTHKLSEELLLAREWDSFNRFSSFVMHDLKNLATLQSMTVENAKNFGNNPEFIADAFATFNQTTEKMINLIASLSVQRGQFSLQQQPVNILQVLSHTFDDLKIDQRTGLKLVTRFPSADETPMISGDPELLRKAFTNLLLNAIQSLPRGEGAVEVTVSAPMNKTITAEIRDTGCGIPPAQLQNLFRPFQTTKKQGMGIGLCHTRSIVEVHGGQIRIESRINAGTKVELQFPTL